MKFRFLSGVIALILTTSLQMSQGTAAVIKDFSVPATYTLTKCQSSAEFDCIDSVGLIDASGNYEPGSLLSEEVPSTPRIFNGNSIYEGTSKWVVNETSITLRGTIDTKLTNGCNGTCAAVRIGVSVPDPLKTKVRFSFRTSWFRPMNVQMKAMESDYKYEKISGGARWTMEGMGMPYSDYSYTTAEELRIKQNSEAKADIDRTFFDFYLHHAGTSNTDSFWDPRCADTGFSVQSHNTNATGDPMWDADSQSLIFSIFAPHFKSTGELNSGYFKFWASHAFMDCKFPTNTLTKSPKLMIQIVNEDGTQSVATTAVTNKNGNLFFSAFGFHFSSPKIMIKAESGALAPSPTPKQTAMAASQPIKKSIIVCVKGKVTKKVTGIDPKCPSGYKKK